jgi:3-hydroxymyristoyl/3-hydroxydecanoyl-(acyl carrier protein) dehydratase
MQPKSPQNVIDNYIKWMDRNTHEIDKIHSTFLDLRLMGMRQLGSLIEQQVKSYRSEYSLPDHALFNQKELHEFATGSVVKCLGEEYAIYAGRRSPRSPNGDLLLMSRVVSIRGRKGVLDQISSITVEYDVPENAWYFNGESHGRLPYSICLEVALQPCGFLSAYLGTPLRFPNVDYYFRNLDGESKINHLMDTRAKTIFARANLLKTIFYGSTIIQHFSFELECDGIVFFEGNSSFGYFPSENMTGQAGLDGRKIVHPWMEQTGKKNRDITIDEIGLSQYLPKGKLRLIDGVIIINQSGNNGEGYVYAYRKNSPKDWFYTNHFFEDPVMPGSLGIEAMFQALKVYATKQFPGTASTEIVTGQIIKWSYRGQVLPHHQRMQLEVHLNKVEEMGKTKVYTGDASLWADDSRIYTVRNLKIAADQTQESK